MANNLDRNALLQRYLTLKRDVDTKEKKLVESKEIYAN